LDQNFQSLLDFLVRTEENFLFFFDNVDQLFKKPRPDKRYFIQFIENILQKCPNVKILITCRDGANQPSNMEMSVKLEGLVKAKQDAWRLFQEQYGK